MYLFINKNAPRTLLEADLLTIIITQNNPMNILYILFLLYLIIIAQKIGQHQKGMAQANHSLSFVK